VISILKKLLGREAPAENNDQHHAAHDLPTAVCALRLEMAAIDGAFDEEEKANIISFLKREYHLSDETVHELLSASKEELDQSVDLWQFARTVNQHYTRDEKVRMMEMIWRVVYADGHLDQHEDYLAHKLSRLLRLSHQELIETKRKATGKG